MVLNSGEQVLVQGPSGVGKTLLLHLLYGLRKDYEGKIYWGTYNMHEINAVQLSQLRAASLSIVFQDIRLFDELTVWENVEVKRSLTDTVPAYDAEKWLERLGMKEKMDVKADTLSGGERQRVAIVRALVQPFEWVEGRFLKITDRKKEIFKTSGGKYVAPQVIENKLKENRFIEQLIVLGAGQKFVSALIVPAFPHLRSWLESKGKTPPADNRDIINMPEVVDKIQRQIDKYNPLFSHPEQIKKFALLPAEWTIDTGELTPSLKIKRKVINEKYADAIRSIYGDSAF